MEDRQDRPYMCLACGFRTFHWPNTHNCPHRWPENMGDWDAKEKVEIENDPRMKEHIDRMNKKYGIV